MPCGRPSLARYSGWGYEGPRIQYPKLIPLSSHFVSQCIADLSIVLRVYKDNLWEANLCPVGRQVRVAAQRA
jgi:hypothetical protein